MIYGTQVFYVYRSQLVGHHHTTSQRWGGDKSGVRRQKRGKQSGIHTRLKAKPNCPALPSHNAGQRFLANIRSLDNKLEHLWLELTTQPENRNCCVLIFTESWLHDGIPDATIQLQGLTSFRADRDLVTSGTSRRRAVCLCQQWLVCGCYNGCNSLLTTVGVCHGEMPREFTVHSSRGRR